MSNSTSNELQIRPTEGGLYEVYYPGGGQLPGALSGRYTYEDNAQRAIDIYQLQMQAKLKPIRDKAEARKAKATESKVDA